MPLSISPVSVHPQLHPKSEAQREGRKQAFQLKLSQETIRAFRSFSLGRKPGQPSMDSVLQIKLDGDKPGIFISDQFFPLSLQPSTPNTTELYVRKRIRNPTRPSEHRPPLDFVAPIVARATVQRVLDDDVTQRVRDRKAEVEQERKDRHIQVLDAPLTTTKNGKVANGTKKKKALGAGTASTLARNAMQKANVPKTSSLRAQVIHQLALKPSTYNDLRALMTPNDTGSLSDILRSCATSQEPAVPKSSQSHWSPAYTSPSHQNGQWTLRDEVLITSVQPFSWPLYDDGDRRRVAVRIRKAFSALGTPDDAPERAALENAEVAWSKDGRADLVDSATSSKAASPSAASSPRGIQPAPVVPTVPKKMKTIKMSEPPSMGGNTLSSNIKQGIIKNGPAKGGSTASTKGKSSSTSGGDMDRGSGKDSDVDSSRHSKKPNRPSNLNEGAIRAHPMSTSSSTSAESALPSPRGLPAKPSTSLGPLQVRKESKTPPQSNTSVRPSPSPRTDQTASSIAAKRKLHEVDASDDRESSLNLDSRSNKGLNGSFDAAKKRKTDSGLSSNALTNQLKTSEIRKAPQGVKSSADQHNMQAGPSRVSNRDNPHRSSIVGDYGSPPNGSNPSSKANRTQSTHDKRPASSSRPDSIDRRKPPRHTYEYTSSEEEEEDEEASKRRKHGANASRSGNINGNPSRPMDHTGMQLRYSELYAKYIKIWADLQGEKVVAERVEAGVADGSTLSKLSTPYDMRHKADEYARLEVELNKLRSAWTEMSDSSL